MNRSKALPFLPVLVLAALSLAACSGPKTGTVCTTNCGSGNGSVAVTMVADTLPAHPSLLTFQVTVASIKFTTSSGTSTTVNLNPALSVDLMRLQSDTVFLGTFANIPAAQYTSVALVLSGNATITFLNDTLSTLSGCLANHVCPLSVAASSNPVATVSFTVSQNAVTGIGIDLNFANAVSISGSPANLVVNFNNNNVLSSFTLPRANSNLAAGQLDLIEDFIGVVSINNQSVTLASDPGTSRGSLTASTSSTTIYDPDPTGVLCPAVTTQLASCVKNNEAASMDVILKSDGTLSIQEVEPLLGTLQDTVEGIVVSITNQTQFTLVVTDMVPTATNSLIGTLHVGDGLTVNLSNNANFLVDRKGLSVLAGSLSNFAGQSNTSAIHLGQSVTVHVIAPFTAAAGSTIASATTDTVTLRWSRFTATPQAPSSPAFNILNPPTYFGFAAGAIFTVQTTTGTPGTAGVTNFDGVPDGNGLNPAKPVALRSLFLENTINAANPAFFAAKIRQH